MKTACPHLPRTITNLNPWGEPAPSTGSQPHHSAAGTLDTPREAGFDYGGTPTSMQPGSTIEVEQARAAVAEFLRTSNRPESVTWPLSSQAHKDPEPFNDADWEESAPET